MKLSREELAWAAGLFDGEGSIAGYGYSKPEGYYFRMQLSISQNDPQVLERFKQAVFGIGKVTGPHARYGNSKPAWKYSVQNFPEVQAIFAALYTFLSPVKREQGLNALTKYHDWFSIANHKPGPRKP